MARKPPSPTAQAAAIVAPQYKALDYAQQRAAAQGLKQQAALTAARDALIQQLQAGVAPAGQVYDAAIQQQQALAQAGAAGLAAANPNAQIQESLRAIGAPQEQQAQLAGLTQGAFPGQGAVLNVSQGTVPGASLAAQKSAAQQFLAGQPLIAGLSGDQSLRALAEASQAQRDKYLEGRMGIAAQIPQLATQLQQQRVENAQADRAFRFQQQQFQQQVLDAAIDRNFRAREAALDRAAAQATTPYQAAQIRLEQQRIQIEKNQAKQASSLGGDNGLQLHNNPDGSVSVFNPNTGASAVVQGPPKGVLPGLSPYESLQVTQRRGEKFDDARTRVRQSVGLEPSEKGGPVVQPVVLNGRQIGIRVNGQRLDFTNRNRAYNFLYNQVAGALVRQGVTRNSVKALINTALNQAGFVLPGKNRTAAGRKPGGTPRSYSTGSTGHLNLGG